MIQKFMMATALTGALTAAMMAPAMAGDTSRVITVTGEGQVEAAPDMATISLGVTHERAEAAEAMAAVSMAMTEMLSQLESLGLDERQLQTSRVTLNPVWSNHRRDVENPPRITGFVASNTLAVQVLNLDRLGPVLDAVIASGANEFSGLQFGIQDSTSLESQARAEAVIQARTKASELAEAAGVALGRVTSISEHNNGRVAPMRAEMAMRMADVTIATGEMSVTVGVNMVFEILDPE